MGRRVPADNISLIEPFVYFSFSFVGLAASIAIITALCSVRFRRKKATPPPTLSKDQFETKPFNASSPPSTMEAVAMSPEPPRMSEARKSNFTMETDNNDLLTKELPLPPAMQVPMDSNMSYSMKRETSERRQSFSLSMKVPKTLSVARNRDQKEDHDGGIRKGKLKADESVWMKTIILGEKCVPDEEEDAIMYEGKGKRVSFSAYHPRKSTSSMSLSRQCSYIDTDAISVPQAQHHEERNQ